jgi:hypothetical protein
MTRAEIYLNEKLPENQFKDFYGNELPRSGDAIHLFNRVHDKYDSFVVRSVNFEENPGFRRVDEAKFNIYLVIARLGS